MKEENIVQVMVFPEYQPLWEVLNKALNQAQSGKGKVRHAPNNEEFLNQNICEINRRLGSADGCLFQAVKKIYESKILSAEAAINELLGAIVYISAAVILTQEREQKVPEEYVIANAGSVNKGSYIGLQRKDEKTKPEVNCASDISKF